MKSGIAFSSIDRAMNSFDRFFAECPAKNIAPMYRSDPTDHIPTLAELKNQEEANRLALRSRYPVRAARAQGVPPPRFHTYEMRLYNPASREYCIRELRELPWVLWADRVAYPESAAFPQDPPSDPLLSSQWGLSALKALEAWRSSTAGVLGQGESVAVVDLGFQADHPDISGQIDRSVATPLDLLEPSSSSDVSFGHGTHVAGIVAAQANNGIGVAGVAPGARLLPINVKGGAASRGMLAAIDRGATVINISLKLPFGSDERALRDAIRAARAEGVVVVAAAGNDNGTFIGDIAMARSVLAVGATDRSDVPASFSNKGLLLDVAAPGVDILSSYPNSAYQSRSGTSMAAPAVAGVAALVLSKSPTLPPRKVADILRTSADDVNAARFPGLDKFLGYGRVNALKALNTQPGCVAEIEPDEESVRIDLASGADYSLRGSAGGEAFSRYEVWTGALDDSGFTKVYESSSKVAAGVLASIKAAALVQAGYLRLVAYDTSGNRCEDLLAIDSVYYPHTTLPFPSFSTFDLKDRTLVITQKRWSWAAPLNADVYDVITGQTDHLTVAPAVSDGGALPVSAGKVVIFNTTKILGDTVGTNSLQLYNSIAKTLTTLASWSDNIKGAHELVAANSSYAALTRRQSYSNLAGPKEILIVNLQNGARTTIVSNNAEKRYFSMSESLLAWTERTNDALSMEELAAEERIRAYHLPTGRLIEVTPQRNSAAFYVDFAPLAGDDLIVFGARTGVSAVNLMKYDVQSGTRLPLNPDPAPGSLRASIGAAYTGAPFDAGDLTLSGKTLVYRSAIGARGPNQDLYKYNLETNVVTRLTGQLSDQTNPVLSGNRLAFLADFKEIHLINLTANPADLIRNGSFETPAVSVDAYPTLAQQSMTPWMVADMPGDDWVAILSDAFGAGSRAPAADGKQVLGFNMWSWVPYPGGARVYQDVNTQAGMRYTLSFKVATWPDSQYAAGARSRVKVKVSSPANGQIQIHNVEVYADADTSKWRTVTCYFSAGSSISQISIEDAVPYSEKDLVGTGVDAVRLVEGGDGVPGSCS